MRQDAGASSPARPGADVARARVLVLCTHNSARSQMTEGFLRALAGHRLAVASAGTKATRVHPLAIRAMDEVGFDLRSHTLGSSYAGRSSRRSLASGQLRLREPHPHMLRDLVPHPPTVVAERDGRVVAWAAAGPYRTRPAYAGVAEHSVYVARAARGSGAGRAALDGPCRAYAERGFWKIVSRIFPENTASLTPQERCGFRVVGVYRRHGKLGSEWRDCVIVEKLLDEDSEGAAPRVDAPARGPPLPRRPSTRLIS